MTIILAFDPGSKECGYVRAEGIRGRVRYESHGAVTSAVEAAAKVIADEHAFAAFRQQELVIGIERPSGFIHDPFRGPTLLDTTWIAGQIAALAWSRKIHVVQLSANQGRKLVIGRGSAGGRGAKKGSLDRLVKDALPRFVDGMPTKTNVHVRDALLVAVATAWLIASRKNTGTTT